MKEKYITEPVFEKHMASIARTLTKIDEKLVSHDKAFSLILNQLKTMQEESKENRMAMSSLMHTDIRYERTIEDILERVDKLERKIK